MCSRWMDWGVAVEMGNSMKKMLLQEQGGVRYGLSGEYSVGD